MANLIGILLALPRLLLTDWRLMMTNIAVIGQVFRHLGQVKLRVLMLPLILLTVALAPVWIFKWIFALPHGLMALSSEIRNERRARKIKTEGARIYPLW